MTQLNYYYNFLKTRNIFSHSKTTIHIITENPYKIITIFYKYLHWVKKDPIKIGSVTWTKMTHLSKKCDEKIAGVKKDPILGNKFTRVIFDPIFGG